VRIVDTFKRYQGEHVCAAEHAGMLTTPLRKLFNDPRRILAGLVRPGEVVIDVGCGPGYFTLPLAEMVGESGRVVAVAVQREMLDKVRERVEPAGLASRIDFVQSEADGPGALGPADFALAFWMVHEVPDRLSFLRQVYDSLKPGGRLLVVEPALHVSRTEFAFTVAVAEKLGFTVAARPRVGLSRAALFRRD
jgi:ubiquinone/menaquinone biosynthesis C-methylase UbiE